MHVIDTIRQNIRHFFGGYMCKKFHSNALFHLWLGVARGYAWSPSHTQRFIVLQTRNILESNGRKPSKPRNMAAGSTESRQYQWPNPADVGVWTELAECADKANTQPQTDFDIKNGPYAWLFLHACVPALRLCRLKQENTEPPTRFLEAVAQIPNTKQPWILRTFQWKPGKTNPDGRMNPFPGVAKTERKVMLEVKYVCCKETCEKNG